MTNRLEVHRTAELPDVQMWCRDKQKNLIDFSGSWTFTLKFGVPGSAAEFTKTTNITGSAGSGTEADGTPNVTIVFTASELDTLAIAPTTGQLTATTSGRDRVFQFPVTVGDVIS